MQQKSVDGHVGLRGIAALTVFMFHFNFGQTFDGGFAGFIGNLCNWGPTAVDLFFLLSGFILCHAYFIGGRIDWESFFVARFARIVPLAIGVIVFLLTLDGYSWVLHSIPSAEASLPRVLANLFLVQGLWGNAVTNSINPPSWSISVEMFLYLVMFPLLCLAWSTNGRRSSRLTFGGMVLSFVGLVLCCNPALFPADAQWVARGCFGFAFGFCARLWLECVWSSLTARWMNGLGWASAAVLVIALTTHSNERWLMILVIATLAITAARNGTVLSRYLSTPVMNWLGERSYSIYIWHHALMIFFGRLYLWPLKSVSGEYPEGAYGNWVICVIAVTLIVAELSYRWFEMPCRQIIRGFLTRATSVSQDKQASY